MVNFQNILKSSSGIGGGAKCDKYMQTNLFSTYMITQKNVKE